MTDEDRATIELLAKRWRREAKELDDYPDDDEHAAARAGVFYECAADLIQEMRAMS